MEQFTSCPWLWLYAGAILMLMELATPGFVVFFFGLSAMTVGLCRFFFGEAFGATWQVAAFSVFTIFYLAVLRRWVKKVFSGDVTAAETDFNHEFVGRGGTVTVAVEPPLAGRVEVGDAEWTAEADAPLPVGASVRVVAQRNLTLKVERV